MAKARAIVKRRKAVRNIRKITKTMQMIATAKFQKSLKRAVGTKPFTLKIRELVRDLASSAGDVDHPLLAAGDRNTGKIAVLVITSNRGLAGAYNGSILRAATAFIRKQEAAGKKVDLYTAGKKGSTYFNYQKRPIAARYDFGDTALFDETRKLTQTFIDLFIEKKIDAFHIVYMNFLSASSQKPEALEILPLGGLRESAERLALQSAESEAQLKRGVANRTHRAEDVRTEELAQPNAVYEFSPAPKELLDYLLPISVKAAVFQAFLDATTSEHVARMVAMTSATDNADKMVKSLTMEYNRARQSQITTELSEIMGGVEAMK